MAKVKPLYESIYKATDLYNKDDREANKKLILSFYQADLEDTEWKVEAALKTVSPAFSIDSNDRRSKTRAQRRKVMQQAQNVIADIALDKYHCTVPHKYWKDISRFFSHLVDYSSANAEANNKKYMEVFDSGEPQKLGNYIFEQLKEAAATCPTKAELLQMSDDELSKKFYTFAPSAVKLAEIQSILSTAGREDKNEPTFTFTEEQKVQIKELEQFMDVYALSKARLDLIANPYYELFDLNKVSMRDMELIDDEWIDTYVGNFGQEDVEAVRALDNAFSTFVSLLSPSLAYEILNEIKKNHADVPLEQMTVFGAAGNTMGKAENISYQVGKELLLHKNIFVHMPDQSMKVLTYSDREKTCKEVTPSAHLQNLTDGLKAGKLFLRGSRQYTDMQKAMTEYKREYAALEASTDPKKQEQMERLNQKAFAAVNSYFIHKKVKPGDPTTYVGKSKNEQVRIDAALAVYSFIKGHEASLQAKKGIMKENASVVQENNKVLPNERTIEADKADRQAQYDAIRKKHEERAEKFPSSDAGNCLSELQQLVNAQLWGADGKESLVNKQEPLSLNEKQALNAAIIGLILIDTVVKERGEQTVNIQAGNLERMIAQHESMSELVNTMANEIAMPYHAKDLENFLLSDSAQQKMREGFLRGIQSMLQTKQPGPQKERKVENTVTHEAEQKTTSKVKS